MSAKWITPAWTGPDSPQGPVPAGTPDRECTVCGTIAPETTMEFEQGSQWNRGTFRCYDTDACDRRASGLYVTGDYDDMERDDGV